VVPQALLLQGLHATKAVLRAGKGQNASLYADFKNVNMTSVKSAAIRSYALKSKFFGIYS